MANQQGQIIQAPDWYRDAGGPQGLKPPPPTNIPDGRPPVTVNQGRSAVPALPTVPSAPSNALALQPQAQPPPLPALAKLPPPPVKGEPKKSALQLALGAMESTNKKGVNAMVAAKVKPAPKGPMDGDKAFVIPGLQAKPYLPEELQIAFEIMDLDRHGEIGATDIRRALRLCGESEPTEAEVQEMIRLMDPDGSGSIEFAEFRKYFVDPPPLFRNFDLHRRGGGDMDLDAEDPESASRLVSKTGDVNEQLVDTLGGKLLGIGDSPRSSPTGKSGTRTQGSKSRLKSMSKGSAHKDGEDPRIQYLPYIAKRGLTPEFIRQLYQKFVEIDTADSGFMSFQAFCTILGKEASERMRTVFDAFDAEREGELDLRQFVIGLSMFANSGLEEKIRFAFMMYDEDQEGSLPRELLAELFRAMAPYMRGPHREAHIERLYSLHNLHPNARATFDEILDYMFENAELILPRLPENERPQEQPA